MKKVITVICCILVTAALYIYICLVVSPKSINDSGGSSYYRGMGFLAEPKNSIDIMVFGNSDVYAGFIPAKLYDQYGFTSYASGTALQTIGQINQLLKQTLRTQKPKLVILEVDCLYEKTYKPIDNTNILLAPFTFHVRWKELKFRDFYTIPDRTRKYDIAKGYVYSNNIYKFENENYMGSKDSRPLPIPRRNLRHLKHFIQICRKNNIEIVFLELPSASSWNYAKHNFIKNFSIRNNIPFIDLNEKDSSYRIDFSKDFRDNGNHMNVNGAERSTLYIGDYLRKKYSLLLADRRSHEKYKHWNDVVDHFYKNITEFSCSKI